MRRTLVIAGASVGGVRLAQAARQLDFDGKVVLLERESTLPYDKPALSKGVATGSEDSASTTLIDDAELATLDIDYRPSSHIRELRAGDRVLVMEDEREEHFTDLVIATGSTPRRLPALEGLRGVHYLRTMTDALAVRDHFRQKPTVVVVGGGFIGAELASSARSLGLDVTIVEAGPRIAGRVLPDEPAQRIAAVHTDHGVRLLFHRSVIRCLGDGSVSEVELDNGERLRADCVVIGVGSVPATDWLATSGLDIDDGVTCDAGLGTGIPGVYAIGDVARWYHPRYQRHVRVEHWTSARDHASVVARRLVGDADAECTHVPYVWSDQFGHRIQRVGLTAPQLTEQPLGADGTAFIHHDGDRLLGVTGIDAQRYVLSARRLLSKADPRVTELPAPAAL